MRFIKSSVTETLCDLLCINELCPFVFLCLLIRHYHQLIVNLWKPFDKHKHLMNTKSMVKNDEAMQLNKGLSSTLLHGNVDQLILTIWWSGNVTAVGPRIYGEKEEMVSNSHVLINRPINIDLGNNGDDNRKKLESKNTCNENTVYKKRWILGEVDT